MLLFNNFTVYDNLSYIDVFDIYNIFHNTSLYTLFPFRTVLCHINIIHYDKNINKIIIVIDLTHHIRYIPNHEMLILIESYQYLLHN